MSTHTPFRKVTKGSYVADIADLHVEIDRVENASGYLDWYLFISRVLNAHGDREVGIYKTYAQTLAEAKVLATAYAEADAILKRAV